MKSMKWLTALALAAVLGVQIGLAKGRELERQDYLERLEIQAMRLKLTLAEAAWGKECGNAEVEAR